MYFSGFEIKSSFKESLDETKQVTLAVIAPKTYNGVPGLSMLCIFRFPSARLTELIK
jgi:hypothetical protein